MHCKAVSLCNPAIGALAKLVHSASVQLLHVSHILCTAYLTGTGERQAVVHISGGTDGSAAAECF